MPIYALTREQRAVVTHPIGQHARVLAVAGSGKTTTMVYRIDYLVRHKQVNPDRIRILMFNSLARRQFKEKLDEIGLPQNLQPQVHTFHSFAYQIIQEMMITGLLPGTFEFWVGDKEELRRVYVHRAIQNLVSSGRIPPHSVDPDDALEAIGLWKGSLIPPLPDRAGYRGNPHTPLVYQEFERLRIQEWGVTFDDFIPLAIGFLEDERGVGDRWRSQTEFVIVDEYQDVNYGQQRLIELLAGNQADVMVVGDDDQTIYEWRGARPSYILREFRTVFSNKPHRDYALSHSFRFGPVLAQCAENVITFNQNRIRKPLLSHFSAKPSYIEVLIESSEQPTDVNRELAEQVVAIVRECRDPRKVIVLGRIFSQLSGLETEFLARRIPYHVLGRAPFFERRELRVLLDYVRLSVVLDQPVSHQAHDLLLSIANTPNRKLSREMLTRAMEAARHSGGTTRQALESLASAWDSPFSAAQRGRVTELLELLDRLQERITKQATLPAGELLDWLVETLNYLQHFDDYYGQSESSEDRKRAIQFFCSYATTTGLGVLDFVHHVEQFDTTQGKPEEEQVRMTTVFRTKGLEYDYVVIPSCIEGYMPFLYGTSNMVYDKAGIVQEPLPSESIENERRLFYVAITRARRGVLIGASMLPTMGSRGRSGASTPSRFLHEIQLEPTIALMGPLQRLAAGQPAASTELQNAVAKHGNVKSIVQNLLAGYLPDLQEHTLAAELDSIAAQLPARPFGYPQTYATKTVGVQALRTGAGSTPQWWDDDDY